MCSEGFGQAVWLGWESEDHVSHGQEMKMGLDGWSPRASRRRWHLSWAGKTGKGLNKQEGTLEQQGQQAFAATRAKEGR